MSSPVPEGTTMDEEDFRWKVGQKVEACDTLGNWYPAKVLEIKDYKMLIHFQRWSSRYDQWFTMDSDLVRELEEIKTQPENIDWKVNDDVLARWTDSKVYPGKIVKMFPDGICCLVWFFDGYRKKIKLENLQKLPDDYHGERFPIPLVKQSSVETPESFACDVCKKSFRKKNLLQQHYKHFHNLLDVSMDEPEPSQEPETPAKSVVKDEPKVVKKEPVVSEEKPKDSEEDKEKLRKEISQIFKKKLETQLNMEIQEKLSITTSSSNVEEEEKPVTLKRKRNDRKSRRLPPNFGTQKGKIATSFRPYLMKNGKPNNVLPFNNAQELAEKNENLVLEEIVKCSCGYEYESGLMVQCEHCFYWQHGSCVGFTDADHVPDGYICPFCRGATCGQGKRKRNISNINHWLKEGLSPRFEKIDLVTTNTTIPSDHEDEARDEKRFIEKVKRTNLLSSIVLELEQNLSILGRQIRKQVTDLEREDILRKQKELREQLEILSSEIDLLESDDEDDEFDGRLSRTSSCSTLSADLPDFFGNSCEFEFDDSDQPTHGINAGSNLTNSTFKTEMPEAGSTQISSEPVKQETNDTKTNNSTDTPAEAIARLVMLIPDDDGESLDPYAHRHTSQPDQSSDGLSSMRQNNLKIESLYILRDLDVATEIAMTECL